MACLIGVPFLLVHIGIALFAVNKLFELSTSQSSLEQFNVGCHWRNARTNMLHDPVRWKFYAIGNCCLNQTNPSRHPWL